MKDRVIDALLDKAHVGQNTMSLINGLTLAQIVCRRHLHDAFDEKCTETLLNVMKDISETIDHIREEYLNNEG